MVLYCFCLLICQTLEFLLPVSFHLLGQHCQSLRKESDDKHLTSYTLGLFLLRLPFI